MLAILLMNVFAIVDHYVIESNGMRRKMARLNSNHIMNRESNKHTYIFAVLWLSLLLLCYLYIRVIKRSAELKLKKRRCKIFSHRLESMLVG